MKRTIVARILGFGLTVAMLVTSSGFTAFAEPAPLQQRLYEETEAWDMEDTDTVSDSEIPEGSDGEAADGDTSEAAGDGSSYEETEEPAAGETADEASADEADSETEDTDTVSSDSASADEIADLEADAGEDSLPAEYLRPGATDIVKQEGTLKNGSLGTDVRSQTYGYSVGSQNYVALYIWTTAKEAYIDNQSVSTAYSSMKDEITDIIMADSITDIKTYMAFANLKNVSHVRLSANTRSFPARIFQECTSLKELYIPKTLETVGVMPFENCSALQTITFENGIKKIPDGFAKDGESGSSGCTLKNVFIPPSVTEIGDHAFAYQAHLENVYFTDPSKTTLACIGSWAFACTNLSGIDLPKFGGTWHDKLMNKNYPPYIGYHAFGWINNSSFRTLVIPEGVVSVGDLWGNTNRFVDIYLPSTLQRRSNESGSSGLLETFITSTLPPALKHIYYNGTEAQFFNKAFGKKVQGEVTSWKSNYSHIYEKLVFKTPATRVSRITMPADKSSIVKYIEDIDGTETEDIELTISPTTHLDTEYTVESTDSTVVTGATVGAETDGKLNLRLTYKEKKGTATVTIYGGQASASIDVTIKDKEKAKLPVLKLNGKRIDTTPVTVKKGDWIIAESETRDCVMEYSVGGMSKSFPGGMVVGRDILVGAGNGTEITVKVRATAADLLPSDYTIVTKLVYRLEMGDVTDYDLDGLPAIPEGMWIPENSYEEDHFYTGKPVTCPYMRVFYYNKLLRPGKDYTVKYADNVQSNDVSGKDASFTVTGKGIYSGARATGKFIILQARLDDSTAKHSFTPVTLTYKAGVAQLPDIKYTLNGKKLVAGRDYKVTFDGAVIYHNLDKVTETGTYSAKVEGIGNYTGTPGSFSNAVFVVEKDEGVINMADVKVSPIKPQQLEAPGVQVTPTFKVTYKGKELPAGLYTPTFTNNTYGGTATLTLRGAGDGVIEEVGGNLVCAKGVKVVTFKIKPIKISAATAEVTSAYTYNGKAQTPYPLVKYGDTYLGDANFTRSYKNNIKAGTATLTIKGIGSFTGKKTLRFPIAKAELVSSMVSLDTSTYKYTVGGVKPVPTVMIGGVKLPKTDYTVSYSGNTTPGTATVTIKGKGSLTGTVTKDFLISVGDIGSLSASLPDKTYANKPKVYVQKPVIKDTNGKKLVAGRDYERTFSYVYAGDTQVKQKISNKVYTTILRPAGESVDPKDIIPAGTVIQITIDGKGNYAGSSLKDTYRIGSKKLSSLSMSIPAQKSTGIRILPGKDQITVKGIADAGDLYDIVSYGTNVNKGWGTVTLRGRGNYTGTKTVKFKIQ